MTNDNKNGQINHFQKVLNNVLFIVQYEWTSLINTIIGRGKLLIASWDHGMVMITYYRL